jgi:hypothetical protein
MSTGTVVVVLLVLAVVVVGGLMFAGVIPWPWATPPPKLGCTSDLECLGKEMCVNNVCISRPECKIAEDCGPGFYCNQGICTPKAKPPPDEEGKIIEPEEQPEPEPMPGPGPGPDGEIQVKKPPLWAMTVPANKWNYLGQVIRPEMCNKPKGVGGEVAYCGTGQQSASELACKQACELDPKCRVWTFTADYGPIWKQACFQGGWKLFKDLDKIQRPQDSWTSGKKILSNIYKQFCTKNPAQCPEFDSAKQDLKDPSYSGAY